MMPPDPQKQKLVLLALECDLTHLVFHELSKEFTIERVIFEEPVSKKIFLKRRIRKLGWPSVLGQLLFMVLVNPWLKRAGKGRIRQILEESASSIAPVDPSLVERVPSVNHPRTIELLRDIQPDLVLVNGTRIISKKVLEACPAPLVNVHVGITPKYRGVHGGYWALRSGDSENCGVTVHLIDPGIDTGSILGQTRISPLSQDNFSTYPYLQMVAGARLMREIVRKWAEGGGLPTLPSPELPSHLWYHPTLWQYLWGYWTKGVK